MRKSILISCLLFVVFSGVYGQIDSQWRGPNRDGVYPNESLLKEWPSAGPKVIWETNILGVGFSSPSVTDEKVYITGMVEGTGYLFAFDHNGKLLWKTAYGPEWNGDFPGARTTPTVVGNRIYLLSGNGKVICFNGNGKIIWSSAMEKFQATSPRWGKTESLLVDGNRVFFTSGSARAMLVAFDRETGKVLWEIKGNGEQSSYCSPTIITHNGRRLLLTMTAKSVVGIDADTGKYLWSRPHETSYDINPNVPLYKDGFLYTVSGYGTGGQMFKLSQDGTSLEKVWENEMLDNQMGGVALVDGYLYGSGHRKRFWQCIDWKTGEVQFSERVFGGRGNIIFSDGMLYFYSEKGDVGLARPNPEKFDVVSTFTMTKGTDQHWAHLVIKNGRLYVRHGDVMMVFDIAG